MAITGLVGEGLHERDLLFGERPDLQAPQHDRAECGSLAQERHREHRAMPVELLRLARIRKFIERGGEVLDVHDRLIQDRATDDSSRASTVCTGRAPAQLAEARDT